MPSIGTSSRLVRRGQSFVPRSVVVEARRGFRVSIDCWWLWASYLVCCQRSPFETHHREIYLVEALVAEAEGHSFRIAVVAAPVYVSPSDVTEFTAPIRLFATKCVPDCIRIVAAGEWAVRSCFEAVVGFGIRTAVVV